MKELSKELKKEIEEGVKEDNVDDIQDLLSNLSINKNIQKIKSPTKELDAEDEAIKICNTEKEVKEENNDDDKEDDSASEGKDESDHQFKVVLHVPEEEKSDVENKPDSSKSSGKEIEELGKEDTQDSDSDDANNPSEKDEDEIDDLKLKLSLFDLHDESSEDDDETKYTKRGPLTDHRNQNRFAPFHSQNATSAHNHSSSIYHSPAHENSDCFVLDVVDFPQLSGTEGFFQGYGLNQSIFDNGESNSNIYPLSPESVYSSNSRSPIYNTNFSSIQNSNDCQFQNEFSGDQWTNGSTPFSDTSYDFGNNGYMTPPKSVSPFLKDGQESNQYGNLGENEHLKESEDLISIIESVNKTYNTNAKGIPESELVKLRSVLEGHEDSIRNEMGMYLKNDSHFQPSYNRLDDTSLNDSASDYTFNFEAPLTPPKSVSPIQEGLSSPIHDFQDNTDSNSYEADKHLIDILNGIDEINPDELNIYLDEDTSACDPSYARNIIQARCKPNNLDHALRRLSSISTKYLCKKDSDGDTCLMIVYSKPEDSQDFYENIFCLQEKVREIRVCCDVPLGKAKRCKVCGNTDSAKFYTPLSLKNKQGDTALSCAVKTDHSPVIISYLLHGILQCPEDYRRVFDERGRSMLTEAAYKYPCLNRYL